MAGFLQNAADKTLPASVSASVPAYVPCLRPQRRMFRAALLSRNPVQATQLSRRYAVRVHVRRKLICTNVAAGAAAAAASANGTASLLISAGIFLLGAALATLALAAIPAVLAMRKTAIEMQRLLRTIEREVPDTAATVRLSGLELSDCVQEVTFLSNDITGAMQASARMVQEAEQGMKQGAEFLNATAANVLLPALKGRVPHARGLLEQRLQENLGLTHTGPTLLQVAAATKVTARRIRFALAAANLAGRAKALSDFLMSVANGKR